MQDFEPWNMRRLLPVLGVLALALLSEPVSRYLGQQDRPGVNSRYDETSAGNVAGRFDYYALVLSWSPTYCADEGQYDDQQCNGSGGRRYAFVLHGLWPQYESGYPSGCRLSRRPFVPEPVIDRMIPIMPSKRLVIHEYRAHGTCSGLDPEAYFSTAHRLFDGIAIPERFRNPTEAQSLSPGEIREEFLRANPRLDGDMLAVACNGHDHDLKEVRFCFSKEGRPRKCGENENQRKLCSASSVVIPPAR